MSRMGADETYVRKVACVAMAFPVPSETFVSNDVRALSERGVDVSVHSLRGPGGRSGDLLRERRLHDVRVSAASTATLVRASALLLRRPRVVVDLVAFVLRRCLPTPVQLIKSLALVPRALEIFADIEKDRPDVVHTFWSHYPSLVLYLVQRHMPLVVTSMSFVAYDIHARSRLSEPVARDADFVRTQARVNLGEIERAFGLDRRDVAVVHDGVDLNLLRNDLLERGADRVSRRIVTAGRLIEAKNMEAVVRVVARLRDAWPDVTLTVLGDGPQRQTLEQLSADLGVEDRVSFLGHVSQFDLATEMARAEVFLFLSDYVSERLPNVAKEAMASRCVCVVSRTEGIDELVEDGRTGFVVDAHDIDAAAARIHAVFAGEVDRAEIADAAAEHVRAAFSLEGSAARYLDHWRRLARERCA